MKSQVNKIDGSKLEITIEVTGDTVKNKFEDVFKRITQEAKVPGFRQGNAPRDIVEKNFSSQAHEQVLKELIPELYDQAVKNEALDVIDMPNITDVKLDRVNLSFKATVEVMPEIKLKDYRGLKIEYKKIEVTADEIKRQIDALKESRKADVIDDSFAKVLGYPNVPELKKAIDKQIFMQKENQQRQKLENSIIEQVTRGLDFKIPEALVDRQLQDLLRHTKVDLAMKGFPREKIEEQDKEMQKHLEPEARNQVRIYLVLNAIAKKENIPLDDHMPRKVIEFLFKEADWKEAISANSD